MSFSRFFVAILLTATGGLALAQSPTERVVEPVSLPLDRPGVWTLYFRYKEPRIITVDVPGKGKQTVWYMWFQVYNKTTDPQYFIPEFELVTHDVNTAHLDEPQPYIVDRIRKIEDPTGVLNMQTTISIAKRPIPPTKPDSIPRAVSGIAVWTDMEKKAPKTNLFSVFISGLSDGLTTSKAPTGETIIQRKTLQIDFIRPTDDNQTQITDIRLDPSTSSPERWIYRASLKLKQGGGAPAPMPEPKKDAR